MVSSVGGQWTRDSVLDEVNCISTHDCLNCFKMLLLQRIGRIDFGVLLTCLWRLPVYIDSEMYTCTKCCFQY